MPAEQLVGQKMATKWTGILLLLGYFTQTAVPSTVMCVDGGRRFHPGEEIRKNCNACYCLQHGSWMCTQRICSHADFKGIHMIPNTDITIREGSKLYVTCQSGHKTARFSWLINGQHVTSRSKISLFKYGESILRLNPHDFPKKTLSVECFVPPFAPKKIKVTKSRESSLHGLPKVKSQRSTIETSPGYRVQLNCNATGMQPMYITWYKFGIPLHNDDPTKWIITPDGSLIVPNPEKDDSGLYECMAVNEVGATVSSNPTELVVNKGLPINGGWCGWNRIGKCSRSCGKETIRLKRSCSCPAPAHGGIECYGIEEQFVDCNLSACPKELFGRVGLSRIREEDVPKGSCIHVGVTSGCSKYFNEYKKGISFSNMTTIRDFKIQSRSGWSYVPYKIQLPGSLQGRFRLFALMQMGFCEDDLTVSKMHQKDCIRPEDIQCIGGKVLAYPSINENVDASYEEESHVLNADIQLRPTVAKLPADSCLHVLVWDDTQCHGPRCKSELRITEKEPKVKNSTIDFRIALRYSLPLGSYFIKAMLNVGWCATNPEDTDVSEIGDYVTLENEYIFVQESVKNIRTEMTMDRKRRTGPKRDLILRGVITLQGFNKLKIPTRRSCLTIQLRESYTCIEKLGCRKPFVSEKRIEFRDGIPVKDGNQIIYEAQFTAVLGRKYKVTGILNLGWCKDFVKGNRKTRLSDFITTGALIISPKHGKVASADLLMSLVQPYHGKRKAANATTKGMLQIESENGTELSTNSCARIILAKTICNVAEECRKIPLVTHYVRDIGGSSTKTIPFKITHKPEKKPDLHLFAVLNVNWCSEGLDQAESVKAGDLVGMIDVKEEGDIGFIKLEAQKEVKFVGTPLMEAKFAQSSSNLKLLLSLPSSFDTDSSSSSCIIVTVRKENLCEKKASCIGSTISKSVLRNILRTDTKNSMEAEVKLQPRLEHNTRYIIDILLNQGWCSEGATNSSLIKDGDLFNSVEQTLAKNEDLVNVAISVGMKVFKEDNEINEKCNLKCAKILDPVCGSDNRTYNSLCILKREACIFNSGLTLLHKGECDRCKRGCSTEISPICARNGKTFDNICIMEREACFQNKKFTFRHFGECASVTMRGDVRFALDKPLPNVTSDSCLIVKTRKAVYCRFPERCPDFELAQVVLRDFVIPPNGMVPFEIIMNPRPLSSVYLVEAVLNGGWCSEDSTSKEWIRNKDYFNVMEQPFAVKGTKEIYKDIPVGKLVNLKDVEKGVIPSAVLDPCSIIECPYHGRCLVVNGKGVCRCKLFCPMDTKPLCSTDGETFANECVMKTQSCLMQKAIKVEYKGPCKKALRVSGDILINKTRPRVPGGSCLSITIRRKCKDSEENCDGKTVAKASQEVLFIPPSNRIYYETNIKPRPPPGTYLISAVLNRGWCAGNRKRTEWIRPGDYFNDIKGELAIPENGNVEKDVVIMRFNPKDDDKSLVVIKGEMIQDDTASKIQNGSCLSISLNRGNASCLAKCDIEPVFRLYIKDLKTSPNNRIPYEAVIKPRPKPGSYIFSVVLNQGWCSDGSNESLREKDLVISQGQKLTIPLVGNIDKDIKIEEYYPPGLACMMTDGKKVPNGKVVAVNGKGCDGCKCNNGSVKCMKTVCPTLDCKDGFFSIKDGDCCPTCTKHSKCEYEESGKMFKMRERLFNREKGHCETCTCNINGKFECSKENCPEPACEKPMYIGSQCCPVCASDIRCKDHVSGLLYKAGDTWSSGALNGCSKCKCVAKSGRKWIGFIECIKPSCPRLNCVRQVYPKGYCCPVCFNEKPNGPFKEKDVSYLQALIFNEVVSSEVSCSDEISGKIYGEGEQWSRGCTSYECKRSGIMSTGTECPYLACPQKYHEKKPGECCPSCSAKCLPKLLCASDAVVLVVPKVFLPYTRPTELVFNNCTSVSNATHFILQTSLNDCGTKRTTEGDLMKYSNIAYTKEDENAVISRVRLVQIPIACLYPAKTRNILSREFVKRNRGVSIINPVPKDTGPVQAFDVFMKVTDANGIEKELGKPIKFDPAEKVFVEISGTGLVENRIKVRVDYCYLTPTPSPKSSVNYTLIENGCAVDSTVEFQDSNGNGQRFSFRALVFTRTKVPGFFLHCDSVTCNQDDPSCTSTCRGRRAVPGYEAKMITRKKADDHSRKMKLTLHVVVG